MRISFMGWYGQHNSGDEAFRDVHRQILPDHDLEWLCTKVTGPASGRRFVLGGGDVVSPFYIDRLPADARFWAYGVGLGGEEEIAYLEGLKGRLRTLWVRGKADAAALVARGIDARYTPDTVFCLRERALRLPPAATAADDPPPGHKRLIVIVSNNNAADAQRRGLAGQIGYFQYLKHELASVLDYLGGFYHITFLPLSFHWNDYDLAFCADVIALMTRHTVAGRPNVRMASAELPPLEAMRLIKGATLVVSMKLHGLIYSAMLGVPFVNFGLSRKTGLFCAENGWSDLAVEPFCFSKTRVLAHVKAAENPAVPQRLSARSLELSRQALAAAAEFRASVLAG